MKKFITKIVLMTLLLAGLAACSDSYFDVNTPSGAVQPEELAMKDLLAQIIFRTMEGQRIAELSFGNYVQNFVFQDGGATGETTISGLWSNVYLYSLPNLKTIKEKAAADGAIHYAAIADILTAINIGIATDSWDNIPFSEASMGQDNLFPEFDTQEEIYNNIFSLLDNAITALQNTDNSNISVGREDLIYKGDLEKWLRAAYTIKARYQLHLVNKGTISASDVLATIANGFTSNEDDFQMFYDEKNINPWYSSEILARNTGNVSNNIASQLVSSMNGDNYPFESGLLEIDPRLPVFASNGGEAEWKGFVSGGGGKAPDGTDANTIFADGGFYTSVDSPLLLISYAEAMFIKAEAAFLANGGNETSVGSTGDAYMAYMEGINASLNKYGVDGLDYMADASVDVGEAGLMLNHIMKEKYIHNFLNAETFVDFRRYDFSEDVFKGLTIRSEDESESDYPGEWYRRATYPNSELNRNRIVVEKNLKDPIDPVWWDQ
jgi:Starch-binding associating with outer membrane